MEKNKENPQQHEEGLQQEPINKGEQQIGRAGHQEIYDISHVDRQEGTMNNGTLGGNFSIEGKENENKETDQNK